MKFLAFSDNHAGIRSTRKIIELASQAELLISVGDFSQFGKFADVFLENIEHLGLPLWLVSGNHEEESRGLLAKLEQQFPFVKNIEKKVEFWENIGFAGCSFAASESYGRLAKKAEKELAMLGNIFEEFSPQVFLTHCPPSNCEVAIGPNGRDGGSSKIRSFIEKYQPPLVLCGHIHKPTQRKAQIGNSLVLNIACQCQIIEL